MTKYIKIIFTASVLLNLILVGILCAYSFKQYQRHSAPHMMSEKTRNIIEGDLKLSRADMKQKRIEMKEQRDDLKKIVSAKDFDLDAYNSLTHKMLESRHAGAKQKAEAIGKVLSQLPYAERLEFSDHMMRQISDGERGPKGNRPDGDRRPER